MLSGLIRPYDLKHINIGLGPGLSLCVQLLNTAIHNNKASQELSRSSPKGHFTHIIVYKAKRFILHRTSNAYGAALADSALALSPRPSLNDALTLCSPAWVLIFMAPYLTSGNRILIGCHLEWPMSHGHPWLTKLSNQCGHYKSQRKTKHLQRFCASHDCA